MKKINNKLKKTMEELEKSNCAIVVTPTSTYLNGSEPELLALLVVLLKHFREKVDKEILNCAIELSTLDDKELEKRTNKAAKRMNEMLKTLLKDLSNEND